MGTFACIQYPLHIPLFFFLGSSLRQSLIHCYTFRYVLGLFQLHEFPLYYCFHAGLLVSLSGFKIHTAVIPCSADPVPTVYQPCRCFIQRSLNHPFYILPAMPGLAAGDQPNNSPKGGV